MLSLYLQYMEVTHQQHLKLLILHCLLLNLMMIDGLFFFSVLHLKNLHDDDQDQN